MIYSQKNTEKETDISIYESTYKKIDFLFYTLIRIFARCGTKTYYLSKLYISYENHFLAYMLLRVDNRTCTE